MWTSNNQHQSNQQKEIKYLDPTGVDVGGIFFYVKEVNFEKKCSYKKNGLMKTKLKFTIKSETIKTINKK